MTESSIVQRINKISITDMETGRIILELESPYTDNLNVTLDISTNYNDANYDNLASQQYFKGLSPAKPTHRIEIISLESQE